LVKPELRYGFIGWRVNGVCGVLEIRAIFGGLFINGEYKAMTKLERTKDNPWVLKTPPGTSEYTMHVDDQDGLQVLVCTVGSTVPFYKARCIDDLYAMLKEAGGWVELGGADELKPAREGTVEAWGRSTSNPVKGWYGLKKGLRGRFGVYIPPLMEALGFCELEHNPKNNRMRAK
jgi:hypothetical protein